MSITQFSSEALVLLIREGAVFFVIEGRFEGNACPGEFAMMSWPSYTITESRESWRFRGNRPEENPVHKFASERRPFCIMLCFEGGGLRYDRGKTGGCKSREMFASS